MTHEHTRWSRREWLALVAASWGCRNEPNPRNAGAVRLPLEDFEPVSARIPVFRVVPEE